MKKWVLLIALIFMSHLQAFAFEDYIITTNAKLTDISIEDNTVINVYPLITLMNDKNTLIVQPLKTGKTRFCLLKNNKDVVMFNVEVSENRTKIDTVDGFDILSIDIPPNVNILELDLPPVLNKGVK